MSFGHFHVWLKKLDKCGSTEQAIQLFLQESARYLNSEQALFLKYIESKKSLVITESVGLAKEELRNVGLDLDVEEPGFEPKMLLRPSQMYSLKEFVKFGLLKTDACYFPLIFNDKVLGIAVILSANESRFSQELIESGYIESCLQMLSRHIQLTEIRQKMARLCVYDEQSLALQNSYMLSKVEQEVSRARRIMLPVSLLYLSIDKYDDIVLTLSEERQIQWLTAFVDVLIKNSRLNDLVGRIQRGQFIICLPHTDKRGAAIKAERLRRLIQSADFSELLHSIRKMTVSVGVSEYPTLCRDAEHLLSSAENAMYEIKKTGGNKICLSAVSPSFEPDFVIKEKESAMVDSR